MATASGSVRVSMISRLHAIDKGVIHCNYKYRLGLIYSITMALCLSWSGRPLPVCLSVCPSVPLSVCVIQEGHGTKP